MEMLVYNYLTQIKQLKESEANYYLRKLSSQPDILDEFAYWIKNKRFKNENAISIRGYSAKSIFGICPVSELGAYTTLLWLRDDPQGALDFITDKMPIL